MYTQTEGEAELEAEIAAEDRLPLAIIICPSRAMGLDLRLLGNDLHALAQSIEESEGTASHQYLVQAGHKIHKHLHRLTSYLRAICIIIHCNRSCASCLGLQCFACASWMI